MVSFGIGIQVATMVINANTPRTVSMPHIFKMVHRDPEPARIQLFAQGRFITAAIIATKQEPGSPSRLITRTDFHTDVMTAIWDLWELALRGKTFVERDLEDGVLGTSSASTTDEEHTCDGEGVGGDEKKKGLGEEVLDRTPAPGLAVVNKTGEQEKEEDKEGGKGEEEGLNPNSSAFEVAGLLSSLQPTVEEAEEEEGDGDDDDDDLYSAEY